MEKKIIYIIILLFTSWIIWKQVQVNKLKTENQKLKLEVSINRSILLEYESQRRGIDSTIDVVIKRVTKNNNLIDSVRSLRDSTYIGTWELDSTNYYNILNQIRNEKSD